MSILHFSRKELSDIIQSQVKIWETMRSAINFYSSLLLPIRGAFQPFARSGLKSLRLRTHSQNRTVAARAIADMKTFGHLS